MEGGRRHHHFIKVMVGDFARRLEIPRDFLIHILEVDRATSDTPLPLSSKGILQNSEGKTWAVQLEKLDGHVFLTTGWAKFVEDNSLREYEFLLFRYDNNMQFMVLPFGLNACEKVTRSSRSAGQATRSLEGNLPCDIFSSTRRGQKGGKQTDAANSLMPSHSQSLHVLEVGSLRDELDEHLSLEGSMEDDKANAIAEVMRTLEVDKVTIDLFCAMLGLYKWNVDAVAEDFDICRGKPQIQNQYLKHKLLLRFDIVKRKLRHFFPPDDDYSSPIPESRKSSLVEPKLSNQPLQCNLTTVKRKLVDEHELCDFSQTKRRASKLQRSFCCTSETPQISTRLVMEHQKNALDSTKNTLEERSEELESSPSSTIEQVEYMTEQACVYHGKTDHGLKGVHEPNIGSLFQDFKGIKQAHGEVDFSEEPRHSKVENDGNLDQGNNRETSEEQTERNAAETSESFTRIGCIESSPTDSEEPACSRMNDFLCFTWKPTEQVNSLEKVLRDIQRDNFVKTISHVQGIIQDHPKDLLTAAVIKAIVQKEILKWDYCLEDKNARRIVNALLEHAKKIKEMHGFNMEMRKLEFSAKLQDQLKWQLKEVENAYTSLESDYKKATHDNNIAFSTLHEQKKKLHALQHEVIGLQQPLAINKDEMKKLAHQVAEHESVFQKSLMERLRIKEVMKSYDQILDEVKVRVTSMELGSIDIEALVKVEMDNMTKEIGLSKKRLLNICFKE
ncbi:hypothetical protein GUJ93_ZPchr0001g31453 [Zizania palustris]|uniref:TF-B3 domain-containing protein n=1 Tax=Zizania palustris TaxID=103762 RepID=A0A8J5SDK9_ZIZPA|nr:hypothetical protein GUJ93_ZPchr0001g31453 [Zizania palustris]